MLILGLLLVPIMNGANIGDNGVKNALGNGLRNGGIGKESGTIALIGNAEIESRGGWQTSPS